MRYPANFKESPEGGFVVTFPDIPEAITQGDTFEEAMEMAEDALLTAMDFYFEDNRPVPIPSAPKKGQEVVSLPASAWAKVLLLNEMLEQKVTQSELARRLGNKPQYVQRLVDLSHPTKIDTLARAMLALGKHIYFEVRVATGEAKIGIVGEEKKTPTRKHRRDKAAPPNIA